MNHRLKHPPTIQLPSNRFEEPIEVDVQAFFDFSFWMSEELLKLENRFASKTSDQSVTKVSH
ncbi:hypothetical protein N9Y42_05355 [Mariniblastus sp.]|nr:hypothetical protein [Mariniblastus sp.]